VYAQQQGVNVTKPIYFTTDDAAKKASVCGPGKFCQCGLILRLFHIPASYCLARRFQWKQSHLFKLTSSAALLSIYCIIACENTTQYETLKE
jgi:hypothetical protein